MVKKNSLTQTGLLLPQELRPVNELVDALEDRVAELYFVGDCNQPRIIMEAIYEGSLAGRQIQTIVSALLESFSESRLQRIWTFAPCVRNEPHLRYRVRILF